MDHRTYDCLIPLGQSCNVTFLLQNAQLKKQTSLFEWFVSNHLSHITSVLNKIITEADTDIIKYNSGHVHIGDSNIYSGHYKYTEFLEIYKRRRDRMLELIRASKNILFVRFEYGTPILYSHREIDDFIGVIKIINPSLENVKLLLITENPAPIVHPSLHTVFFNKHHLDPYCKGEEINKLFVESLRAVGVNVDDKIRMTFTDKSEI